MYKHFFKRIIDFLISLIALPFVLLTIIIFGPLIFFTDCGPIFYCGKRIGKDGKVFKMIKFRSMYVNSPDIRLKDGSTYNGEKDGRVTKIGRFLRKTSIDELPQFFNVMLGHMSLIGPRPNLPPHNYYSLTDIEKKRLKVRPGITGYNQAYYRNSVSMMQKFENDVFYVDNISFLFDTKILFKTLGMVLKRKNIYNNKEEKK